MTVTLDRAPATAERPDLIASPLLPDGYRVPASRHVSPSVRMRDLLRTEPYLFGPGVYDPMGAQLVMHHGFKAVYFSGYSFAIGHLGTTDVTSLTRDVGHIGLLVGRDASLHLWPRVTTWLADRSTPAGA